jgi:acetylornithine deacetylase/succinyl-diaminopimelate desuccinylase-like protein
MMHRAPLAVALSLMVCAAPLKAQTTMPPAERAAARAIFRELVEMVTTDSAGNTPRTAQAMADRLIAAGIPAADVHVLSLNPKVGMLVARLRGRNSSARPILLMAHLDVVPANRADWTVDPYAFQERDGWFFGRGTSDDKGGASILVTTLARYAREHWRPERDIIVALTGDEETAGASIASLVTDHRDLVDAEFALNADAGSVTLMDGRPRVFAVQASEKVYMDYQLEVTDAGGHSSLPRAVNPIYTLSAALVRLGAYQFPLQLNDITRTWLERSSQLDTGQLAADKRAVIAPSPDPAVVARLSAVPYLNARLRTTCVATRLDGGHANNALPQRARATINCRVLPGQPIEEVTATLRRLAGDSVTLTELRTPVLSPPSVPPPALMATFERLSAEQWPGIVTIPYMETGATDGLYTRNGGIPTYGVEAFASDPNDVRAHGRDERLGVEAYYDAAQLWYRMVKELAGSPARP